MPCSLAAACATAANASGSRSFGGVLIRSRARLKLLGDGGGALDGRLVLLVAGLAAEEGGLGERGLAVLGLLVLAVVLVGVEGVRAEQHALADRADGGGVLDRQREGGLLGADEGAGGGARRLAQDLGVEGSPVRVLFGLRAQAHRHHDRGLEAGGRGQLGHLALGAGGTERLQDARELAVVGLVHGLGAGRHDQVPRCGAGALGHTDHDRIGPKTGRRGGAESESSHGGEFSLPM